MRAFALLGVCVAACSGEVGGVVDSGVPPVFSVTLTSAPAALSRDPDPAFGFTGTAPFECALDAAAFAACTSPLQLTGVADGAHELRVRAGTAIARASFTIDTVPPAITLTGTQPPFSFTASEPASFECRVVPEAFAACASPASPAAGTFEVRATDPAGNASVQSRTWAPASTAFTLTGPTFAIPTTTGQVRHAAVAHDSTHDLYAVAYGNGRIGVTCITADGAAVGAPIDLSQTASWTQSPWLAYGAQADIFLAAWFDTRGDPNRPAVYGRLFRCAAATGAAAVGDDFPINTDGTFADARNQLTVAYSPGSQVFFVAWPQKLPNGKLAVLAQRVSPAGALAGGAITVMPERDWYEAVRVAHDPVADEFMAIAATVTTTAGVSVQRVRGDGTLQGTTLELVTGLLGAWTPQVVYVPGADEFFATWFQGTLQAVRVSKQGAAIGLSFPFAPGQGAAEGLHLGISPVTGSFAAVFHGQSFEDYGQLLGAAGPRGEPMTVTQSPAGTNGNFDPRIVAHPTRREWLVVSSRNFNTLVGQRLGE